MVKEWLKKISVVPFCRFQFADINTCEDKKVLFLLLKGTEFMNAHLYLFCSWLNKIKNRNNWDAVILHDERRHWTWIHSFSAFTPRKAYLVINICRLYSHPCIPGLTKITIRLEKWIIIDEAQYDAWHSVKFRWFHVVPQLSDTFFHSNRRRCTTAKLSDSCR